MEEESDEESTDDEELRVKPSNDVLCLKLQERQKEKHSRKPENR